MRTSAHRLQCLGIRSSAWKEHIYGLDKASAIFEPLAWRGPVTHSDIAVLEIRGSPPRLTEDSDSRLRAELRKTRLPLPSPGSWLNGISYGMDVGLLQAQRTANLGRPWPRQRCSPHRGLEPVTSEEEAPTSMKREPDAKFELNGPSGITTTGACHLIKSRYTARTVSIAALQPAADRTLFFRWPCFTAVWLEASGAFCVSCVTRPGYRSP